MPCGAGRWPVTSDSRQLRPPPLPKEPFTKADDVDTLPGMFSPEEVMQLRRDLRRVRGERDDALSALRSSSEPPPLRRYARTKRAGIEIGKVAVIAPVLVIAGNLLAKRWPEFAELIRAILATVGL